MAKKLVDVPLPPIKKIIGVLGKPPVKMAIAANKKIGATLPIPKGIVLGNTKELNSSYFRGCIYSEYGARKTTTAALFGTPENTRIIMTRHKEQLMPLKNMGYEYVLVENARHLNFALTYPEQLWPDWAERDDRVLIFDVASEGENMWLDDVAEDKSGFGNDYKEAKGELRTCLTSALRKPMHLIIVALAKSRPNPLTGEERIGPSLSPSLLGVLLTDVNYVFYIDPKTWQFITNREATTFKGKDDKGRGKNFIREIFAKRKLPIELEDMSPPLLSVREPLDLRAIWDKVLQGKV